jgi:predicted DNA-binding protein (MmcQ/YjbR family)
MVTIQAFRKLALSFPETVEEPHFENTSFRVKKKIFATLSVVDKRGCLKLSAIDQSVFCSFDKTIIYPVNNKWGKQGWTQVELKKMKIEMLKDALTTAYCEVAPKSLAEKYRMQDSDDQSGKK